MVIRRPRNDNGSGPETLQRSPWADMWRRLVGLVFCLKVKEKVDGWKQNPNLLFRKGHLDLERFKLPSYQGTHSVVSHQFNLLSFVLFSTLWNKENVPVSPFKPFWLPEPHPALSSGLLSKTYLNMLQFIRLKLWSCYINVKSCLKRSDSPDVTGLSFLL